MTVRTRFAPSPTGYLHLGGLRTALYTYLFAKKNGGKFILRIEDTDQEREVPGAVDLIYQSMREAGLRYDEGPDVGGDFGPYIQTQRRDLYLPYAMELVEKGAAYPCFCTKEELQERRDAAAKQGEQWKYDKHCLHIPKEEALRRMQSGEPFVIRQNVPTTGVASFDDALYGHVEAPCDTLDDNVLIKADGLPTYNFANVIDDHLMGITHVMRGTEYLSSTPKYNLLYEAFGWEKPTYIHLSPVMKDASRKLSKRYGDPSFEDLLAQGYVKDAIINFIALLGWCPDVKKYGDREFFTLDELVEAFDLSGLSKSPAIFNVEKLDWFNHEYITRMPFEEYLERVTPWFDKVLAGKNIDYRRLAELMHSRTEVFNRVPDMVKFLAELPEYNLSLYRHQKMKTDLDISLKALTLARGALNRLEDFSEESVKGALMPLAAENGLKTGQMMWPVRTALSGLASTPGGATEIAYLLGKEETLRRLDIGIQKLEKSISTTAMETKWQKRWEENGVFRAEFPSEKPKYYCLIEFPYPSGNGLHVGHPRSNTALDIIARKRRMEGYNVLYPIGYDAFGLPTENFAIKNKIHPATVTQKNIDHFREQLQRLGFSFDYSREVNTTDPAYYKWTQWIFLKLFEKGLAYKAEMPINWCTGCKCGLANEEVVGGVCERCGSQVVRKVKSQWMLKITAYAQKLLDGLDHVDFIEPVKIQQRNWIGRSEGAEVDFQLAGKDEKLRVYTTRPDTLFGATYMVVSPEHPLIEKYKDELENYDEIAAYRGEAAKKSDFERTELAKDKTGVEIRGIRAVNPVNGKEIPIWVSDYVLMSYGTGAIMAVPAHDTRDWEFAHKFQIPMIEVVAGGDIAKEAYTDIVDGVMVNSGFLDGLRVKDAKKKIIDWLAEKGLGERKVNYKLRDWVFSRQRYWGEPIPVVHCPHCGAVPVPEDQLPVLLPNVKNYEPTDSGESPLSTMTDWVNTTCPHCGGPAKRETDTMPQWAGSSWYFLRYCDPHNDKEYASQEALDYFMPVDWYNGGMEHTTLHLLYSRFWHLFLHDIGAVKAPEPYQKRTSHGMILGENNEKMSKSRGNVINPDDIVDELGADAFRLYEMFMGAFDQAIPWSTTGARGCRRFLDRVWRLTDMVKEGEGYSEALTPLMHETIKKVGEDYEAMKFNTAIAAMMSLVNEFYAKGGCTREELRTLLLLLSPVAPHMCEEMWELLGFGHELAFEPWPAYDEAAMKRSEVEIGVQINGKVRGRIMVSPELTREQAEQELPGREDVKQLTGGKTIVKVIYVPGRLCNLIVK